MANDGYFGLCPICKKTDGCLNVGANHWFICKKHRVRWCIGANLFSDWRYETESEQKRRCEEIGFDAFKDVEPFYPDIEGVVSDSQRTKGKRPTAPSKKSTSGRRIQG